MKLKNLPQVFVLLALLLSFVPGQANALLAAAPPADIFQLPWTQGEVLDCHGRLRQWHQAPSHQSAQL